LITSTIIESSQGSSANWHFIKKRGIVAGRVLLTRVAKKGRDL